MATDWTDPAMPPALMKCRAHNIYNSYMECVEIYFSPCSWDMMMSCWSAHPHQRPEFTSLVKKLFDLLDRNSNYLKLN